ncbi:MAG: amino acid ABC transporter substrate-binding protein [Flavobacteriales bacterium]|nr:amino acid ABC transporter substrate-binding protein [Flavobacteriales bacterium]
MSGNKFLAFIAALLLISCNAFKTISRSNEKEDVVVSENEIPAKQEKTSTETKTPETKKTIESEAKKTVTIDFFGEKYQVEPHKTEFNAALILPFFYHTDDAANRQISTIMVQYYQGFKMALSALERDGLKLKLHVFDNENNADKLKTILANPNMKNMDLIIGPIGEEMITSVADFGLKNSIPVFSPFTTIETQKIANQILYCTTPNNDNKAQRSAEYVKKKFANSPVVILTDGKAMNIEYETILKAKLRSAGISNITSTTYGKTSWGNMLLKDKKTVVFVLSYTPSVVNTTLGSIYQTRRDVAVFGFNAWSDFMDNDYNFWDKTHVHLVASDFVNDSSNAVINFRQNFRLQYREDPGVYSYLGYDQMKFAGEFLMAFGSQFPTFIDGKEFRYLSSNFKYRFENGCNQNENVFILKFEDYQLKAAE